MEPYMISTTDNPWNPFLHFNEWDAWDRAAGYHTTAYLARIIITSTDMSEPDQTLAYQQAVDEIIEHNVTGTYIKVTASSTAPRELAS